MIRFDISSLLVFVAVLYPATFAKQASEGATHYCDTVVMSQPSEASEGADETLVKLVAEHNRGLIMNPAAKNRNRIVYVDGPNRYKPVLFAIAPQTRVVDGFGNVLGHIASGSPSVQLNFGQHKNIDGEDHVMVFGAQTADAGPLTGWIARSSLLPSPERDRFATELSMVVEGTKALGDGHEKYKIDCDDADRWFNGRLKILPNVDDKREKHEAASDYVGRPGGFCYLLTSLPGHGGVATDTLPSGTVFIPDAGMPRVLIPLYLPLTPTDRERKLWDKGAMPRQMEFRYGRAGSRYGWIASANLHQELSQIAYECKP